MEFGLRSVGDKGFCLSGGAMKIGSVRGGGGGLQMKEDALDYLSDFIGAGASAVNLEAMKVSKVRMSCEWNPSGA